MLQEIFLICGSAGNLSTFLKISVIIILFFSFNTVCQSDKPSDRRTFLGKRGRTQCKDDIQVFGRSAPWQQVRRPNSTGAIWCSLTAIHQVFPSQKI